MLEQYDSNDVPSIEEIVKFFHTFKMLCEFGKNALKVEYFEDKTSFSYPLAWDLGVTSEELLL